MENPNTVVAAGIELVSELDGATDDLEMFGFNGGTPKSIGILRNLYNFLSHCISLYALRPVDFSWSVV